MPNNNNIIKAQRGKVQVAGLEMNIYFLPDATYCLAGRNVTDAIGEENRSLGRIMRVETLKDLPYANETPGLIKTTTGESFQCVSPKDAITYWSIMAIKGNAKAILLIGALSHDPSLLSLDKEYVSNCLSSFFVAKANVSTLKKEEKSGYIYLFEGVDILKLGYSTSVKQRLKALARWDGELEIIAKVEGTIEKEKSLHSILHKTGVYFGAEWYPAYRKHEILGLMIV